MEHSFSGLSLGGGLTLTMLFNATNDFSSFCIMSNTPSPPAGDALYNSTAVKSVEIFVGAGFYDIAFDNSRDFQARMTQAGLTKYKSHYPQNGGHQWSVWQEILYQYLRFGLWKKPNPKTVYSLGGGVPY